MTNDNNIRTRASAVFFSVIMVLSMVAVGFAGFAGSAAAADSPSVQLFTNNAVSEGTTVTHDLRATVRDVSDAAIRRVTVADTDRSGGFSGVADADVSFADAAGLSGERVYVGQVVAVGTGGSVGDPASLRRATGSGSSTLVSRLSVAEDDVGNRYVQFETADRQPGEYFLTGSGFDRDNSAFEVVRQDLTAEFDAETVDNDGPNAVANLTIESEERDDYDAVIAIDGFDEEDYDALVDGETALDPDVGSVTTSDDGIRVENASGDHRIDFTGVAGGDATVTVSVVDADAEATAPVTVNGVSFATDRATVPQGDVADVTITFHGTQDTAHLRIGDVGKSGYVANVRVEAEIGRAHV